MSPAHRREMDRVHEMTADGVVPTEHRDPEDQRLERRIEVERNREGIYTSDRRRDQR